MFGGGGGAKIIVTPLAKQKIEKMYSASIHRPTFLTQNETYWMSGNRNLVALPARNLEGAGSPGLRGIYMPMRTAFYGSSLPWASTHRGKWGQLTSPGKMDEKLKGENLGREV